MSVTLLNASVPFSPGGGSTMTVTVPCPGAAVGDPASAGYTQAGSVTPPGVGVNPFMVHASVVGAGEVEVRLHGVWGFGVTAASLNQIASGGTLNVVVMHIT